MIEPQGSGASSSLVTTSVSTCISLGQLSVLSLIIKQAVDTSQPSVAEVPARGGHSYSVTPDTKCFGSQAC